MFRKLFLLFLIAAFFSATGCVKETYDMSMLSKKVQVSPTWAVSAVRAIFRLVTLSSQMTL
jgi:hypothetical protein